MRKILLFPLFLVLIAVPFMAQAETITDEALNKIMELSGLNEQIAYEPEGIKKSMREIPQTRTEKGKQLLALYEQAVDEVLDPQAFLNEIRKEIKANISHEQALSILGWLESDLGRKFTQKEIEITKTMTGEEVFLEVNELLADQDNMMVAQVMSQFIVDLDSFSETMRYSLIPIIYMTEILAHPDVPLDETQIKHDAKYSPMTSRNFATQIITMSLAYTYKDMPQEEKEQYIDFLITEDAQAMYRAVNAAKSRTVNPALEEIADVFLEKARAHPDFLNNEEL